MLEAAVTEGDGNVDLRAQHVHGAVAGHQADVDFRVGFVEAVQARHQPVGGEGEVGGHLQHLVLGPRAHRLQAEVDGAQAVLHMNEEQAPAVSQFDAAVDAVEQPRRQLLLQALDLLAHRRLGGAQLHRCGGEAQVARRRFEYAQQVEGEFGLQVCHNDYLSEACPPMRFTEKVWRFHYRRQHSRINRSYG